MQQDRVKGQDGRFLATMLRRARCEDGTDFSDQGSAHPEAAGLVEKVLHLRRHIAETGRRSENDRIVIGELVHRSDGRLLVELVVSLVGHFDGDQLGHALDRHLGTAGASALRCRISHLLDMAPCRIIKHQYFSHDVSFLGRARSGGGSAEFECPRGNASEG